MYAVLHLFKNIFQQNFKKVIAKTNLVVYFPCTTFMYMQYHILFDQANKNKEKLKMPESFLSQEQKKKKKNT